MPPPFQVGVRGRGRRPPKIVTVDRIIAGDRIFSVRSLIWLTPALPSPPDPTRAPSPPCLPHPLALLQASIEGAPSWSRPWYRRAGRVGGASTRRQPPRRWYPTAWPQVTPPPSLSPALPPPYCSPNPCSAHRRDALTAGVPDLESIPLAFTREPSRPAHRQLTRPWPCNLRLRLPRAQDEAERPSGRRPPCDVATCPASPRATTRGGRFALPDPVPPRTFARPRPRPPCPRSRRCLRRRASQVAARAAARNRWAPCAEPVARCEGAPYRWLDPLSRSGMRRARLGERTPRQCAAGGMLHLC